MSSELVLLLLIAVVAVGAARCHWEDAAGIVAGVGIVVAGEAVVL